MNNSLNLMHARLKYHGGAQQNRMIKDKRETLDKVVLYSYQGAVVQKLDSAEQARALINPNTVKQDYDDKIISIGYEYGYEPGTVFEWINTGTKWLIYLQDLTELAYFKGNIRKCKYEISWKDENGNVKTTYAAVRGPVETRITSSQTGGISLDVPNYTLSILLPKNEDTLKYFQRYTEFYLKDNPICWRVEAIDIISTPGIIELTAKEYYANENEDDINNGIVGGLIEEIIEPSDNMIYGDTFIKPKVTYNYKYKGEGYTKWDWDPTLPIDVTIEEDNSISIKWLTTYTGQFTLYCGEHEKTIVVESLF